MKRTMVWMIMLCILLSGCSTLQASNNSQSATQLQLIGTLEHQLSDVNLTGHGGDSISGAYFTLNDDIAFVILQITLSDGYKMATKFDGKIASYDLSCGYLNDTKKQCIVLQTHAPSNYESTNIYVLSVENDPHSGSYLKEELTLLDGYSDVDTPPEISLFADSAYRIPNPLYSEGSNKQVNKYLSTFTSGGGVVNIPGESLQGLRVNIQSFDKIIYAIITWNNSHWISTVYDQ